MHEPTFINLAEAYLCNDCEAVGNSANRCPRCQSDALIALTRALPRHRDSIRMVNVPLEEEVVPAAWGAEHRGDVTFRPERGAIG
jgi:hypothetical protein